MPDAELTQFLIAQGGFAVSFLLVFMFYRKDVKSYTELWRSVSESMIAVVKDNTASNTRLIATIDTMQGVQAQMLSELRFLRSASRRVEDKSGTGDE